MRELSNYLKHSNQTHPSLHLVSMVTDSDAFIWFSLNTDNYISDEGAVKLAEALISDTALTALKGNRLVVTVFSLTTGNKINDEKLHKQIAKSIFQNTKLWREIHECIRINDFQQLMTLLSKHPINLNCFNLSADGDTILHSAAKSNSVKMIEFVLQRMSSCTKQRMLKMKNKQQQLPVDLLTVWTPSTH
jgi:hypothetical protein